MFTLTAIVKKEFRGNTEEKIVEIKAERLSAILVKLTEADELMGSDEEMWRISGGHAGLVNRAMEYGYHSNPVGWSIQRLVILVNGVEVTDPQYERCADFINEAIY